MPPKGWKKSVSVSAATVKAGVEALMESATPLPDDQKLSEAEHAHLVEVAKEMERPLPVPGARKSGLSANLDQPTQERIAAVNEVTIMCKGGLGRFDFKSLWLKQFPDAIPVGELTPRLKSAVLAADEIWINCKMKRPNDPDVTLNHSRHNGLWLKEYV